MPPERTLLLSAVVPPALAIGAALLLRGYLPASAAYFAVWGVYLVTLLVLCLTVLGREGWVRATGPSTANPNTRRFGATIALVIALPAWIWVAPSAAPHLTATQWALVAGLALVNAPLEEAYWRGAFATRFADVGRAVVWPTVAFSAWHVALALIPGIRIEAVPLVGGAAFLGLLWALVSWFTGTIRWAMLGHVLLNLAAFTRLVHENDFGTSGTPDTPTEARAPETPAAR